MATEKKGAGGGDVAERINKMVEDAVEKVLGKRDREEAEAKDPWKRIEGIVDRAVEKHMAAFAAGVEDAEREEGDGKPKGKAKGGGDDPLSLFG